MATEIGGANAEVGYLTVSMLIDEETGAELATHHIQRVLLGRIGAPCEVEIEPGVLADETLRTLQLQVNAHALDVAGDEADQRELARTFVEVA